MTNPTDCTHYDICAMPCPYEVETCDHFTPKKRKTTTKIKLEKREFINKYGNIAETRKFICAECGYDGIKLNDNFCANCGLEIEKEPMTY